MYTEPVTGRSPKADESFFRWGSPVVFSVISTFYRWSRYTPYHRIPLNTCLTYYGVVLPSAWGFPKGVTAPYGVWLTCDITLPHVSFCAHLIPINLIILMILGQSGKCHLRSSCASKSYCYLTVMAPRQCCEKQQQTIGGEKLVPGALKRENLTKGEYHDRKS